MESRKGKRERGKEVGKGRVQGAELEGRSWKSEDRSWKLKAERMKIEYYSITHLPITALAGPSQRPCVNLRISIHHD